MYVAAMIHSGGVYGHCMWFMSHREYKMDISWHRIAMLITRAYSDDTAELHEFSNTTHIPQAYIEPVNNHFNLFTGYITSNLKYVPTQSLLNTCIPLHTTTMQTQYTKKIPIQTPFAKHRMTTKHTSWRHLSAFPTSSYLPQRHQTPCAYPATLPWDKEIAS
jgi:hypothetical protein